MYIHKYIGNNKNKNEIIMKMKINNYICNEKLSLEINMNMNIL